MRVNPRGRWGTSGRVLAVAAAVLATLGSAACGSSSGDSSGLPASPATIPSVDLTAVMDRTVTVPSATVDMRMSMTVRGEHLEMTMASSMDLVEGTGSGEASGGAEHLEFRVTPDRAWIRSESPQFLAALPDGAEWIEAPTARMVEMGVMSTSPEVTWAQYYFLAGAENVREEGGGVYSFDVDLDAAQEGLDPERRRAFNATVGDFADPELVRSASGTVRIDEEGRAIELHIEVRVDPGAGPDATFVIDVSLTDVGAPVTVEAPPASQVATVEDHPELAEMLSGPGPGY